MRNEKRPTRNVLLFSEYLRGSIIANAVLSLAAAITTIGIAFSIGKYVPPILSGDTSDTSTFATLLILLGILRAIVSYSSELVNARTYISVTTNLRDRILRKLALHKTESELSHQTQHATILTSGINSLEPYIRQYVPAFIEGLIIPILVLAGIFFADVTSGIIVVATVPLVPVFMILIGKQTRDVTSRQWSALSTLSNQFSTFLQGISTLRMYGKQEHLVEHIDSLSQRYRRILMRTLRFAFLSAFALEAIATLSIAIVAVTLGVRLTSGSISLATALFVLFAVPECYWPLRRLGSAFHAAETGKDAAAEINSILDIVTPKKEESVASLSGTITISNACIQANDIVRMECPSEVIHSGQLVGLRGPNGTGKSTLIKAMSGRIELTSGSITIDQQNVNELAPVVAYIPQEFTIYGDTVAQAITWSENNDTDAALVSLANELNIEDLLTHDIHQLSGGQRQRVCIANALYNAEVREVQFIFADEPTSQLDEENALKVVRAFKRLADAGKTVVIATHDSRISSYFDSTIDLTNKDYSQNETTATPSTASPVRQTDFVKISEENTQDLKEGTQFFRSISKRLFARSLYAVSIASIADLFTVALTGVSLWLVVRASQQPLFSELALAALFVRICGIGKAVFRYIERLTTHAGALDIVAKLRSATTKNLVRLAPAGFPELRKGDMLGRFVDDHEKAQDLFIRSVLPTFSTLLTGIVSVIALAILSPTAGIILGGAITFTGIAVPAISMIYENRKRNYNIDLQNKYTREVCDYIDSLEVLQSPHGITFSNTRIQDAARRLAQQVHSGAVRSGILRGMLALIPATVVAITVWATDQNQNDLSAPVLGIIFLVPFAVLALYEAHYRFGEVFADGARAWARIHSIISREVPIHRPHTPQDIDGDDISLSHATFRWEEVEPACENISLDINEESPHLVVRGESGSGKSTLAAGLVRFIDVHNGQYLFDHRDVAELDEDDVRKHVVWNQQSPWLLPGTIRENLLLANANAQENEIIDALKKVHAWDFVLELENKLDHDIGINGELLSIGEKNKIALARTLLSLHKVRIFDEPTASLDEVSATALISEVLDSQSNKFTILITHEQNQQIPHDVATVECG